jgi:transposase
MAYDSREFRQWLRGKGIKPTIPLNPRGRKRKRPGRPIEVGPHYAERWKVERLFSWLGNFRRLLVRQDRYPSIFRAFVVITFILICLRHFGEEFYLKRKGTITYPRADSLTDKEYQYGFREI